VSDLTGIKIVLLEARMNSELSSLVQRQGGEPVSVPAVREATLSCAAEVGKLIDSLTAHTTDYVVFQTGVGVTTLLNEAENIGRRDELITALRQTKIVARGPKPTAVLSRNAIQVDVATALPFTTSELLAAMQSLEVENKTIAVLHYGERNTQLAEHLTSRGAILQELCLYEWQLPEDTTRLKTLIDELIGREFTAIAFTSQIQARHLLQLATESGKAAALREALLKDVVVASVGPTCTAALHALGITPQVEPENPKMGSMVVALTQYLKQHRQPG
jgi:uroporphyrinogen-III synthase